MNRLCCYIILLLTCLLTGCGDHSHTDNVLLPYPPVVVWENKAYAVTDVIVLNDELGDKIGEVKRYVDPDKDFPERDEDSTIAPVGSDMFQIKGADLKHALAIELNGQYIKAEHHEP